MISTRHGEVSISGTVTEILADLGVIVCSIKRGFEGQGMSPGFVDKRIEETIAKAIRHASMTPEEESEDARRSIEKTIAQILEEIGGMKK